MFFHYIFGQIPDEGVPVVWLKGHGTSVSRGPVPNQVITSFFCQFREVVYNYQYLIISCFCHAVSFFGSLSARPHITPSFPPI